MKVRRRGLRALLTVLLLVCVLLLLCFVCHRISLARERPLLSPLGQLVEVDGQQMSVYTEGGGPETLVFLSGGGTCSPILDFRSLYTLLSGRYRIAVVEKFGYGFSDDADAARDIDTILSQTRQALEAAGVDGPYVLCPHSMSGIEAIYWAQQYPEEVRAIVGLDMAVPAIYEDFPIDLPLLRLGQLAARLGITRLLPGLADGDAVRYGTLTEEEKDIYRALFYRRTASGPMLREAQCVQANAEKAAAGGIPDVPMLLFCSNGEGTGWDCEKWRSYPRAFADGAENVRLVELDCGHYVHDREYAAIAAFLSQEADP